MINQIPVFPALLQCYTDLQPVCYPPHAYLLNLPEDVAAANIKDKDGHIIKSLGEAVNNAMQLIEAQSEQLTGVLPKTYTGFSDEILSELLRIFNNAFV